MMVCFEVFYFEFTIILPPPTGGGLVQLQLNTVILSEILLDISKKKNVIPIKPPSIATYFLSIPYFFNVAGLLTGEALAHCIILSRSS